MEEVVGWRCGLVEGMNCKLSLICVMGGKQSVRERGKDREPDRQTDRQNDRQTDRQNGRQIETVTSKRPFEVMKLKRQQVRIIA